MRCTSFLIAGIVFPCFLSAAYAADTKPLVATPPALTKEDVAGIVKETIMNDPTIIMQALDKLRAQKADEAKKEASKALEKNKAEIYENPDVPSAGAAAADADMTVVEFFDYHCGYCKHFLPELTKVLADDKKLRVLFIDLPILSEDSVTAARAAIAVHRISKDKYFAFHTALMQESGKFDEKRLLEVAKKQGIKTDLLKAEMAKPEITAALDQHRKLAQELNINGTPAIIVGSEVIPGAMSAEELKELVTKVRAEKTTAPVAVPSKPAAGQ